MTLGQAGARPQIQALLAPASVMPEEALFRGYSAGSSTSVRVEACACGGQIAALAGDWQEITEAVRAHQRSSQHRGWSGAA